MLRKATGLKMPNDAVVDRVLSKEIQAPCSQGLLISQVVAAVQVKVFASDVDDLNSKSGNVLSEVVNQMVDSQTLLYTRTFRVGLKTCLEHLRRSASEFWGLNTNTTMLYIIDEDGTLRDLQFDGASCVTKIVE